MKMIKTTFLTASLVCFATLASAQETTTGVVKITPAKVDVPEVKVEQEYALPTDKLLQAFESGEIPKDFPKYDAASDKRINKKTGIAYLVDHQDILSEEAIAYLKEHKHI